MGSYHEKVKQNGYDVVGRHADDRSDVGDTFDRIVGQAALCGTLTIPNLLQMIRPYVVQGERIDLDTVAHMLLEL